MLEGHNNQHIAEILSLADALRTPLLQLHVNSQSVQNDLDIRIITEHALRDIEAFITTYTHAYESQVAFSTLSLGSVIADVSEKIKPYAKLQGLEVTIDDHTKHQPVIGEPARLLAGLELVAKSVCDFSSDAPEPKVILRADTRHGYPRLGVYRDDIELSAEDVRLARSLIGGAKVNAGLFKQLSALRIVIASRLLEPLGVTLRSARSAGNSGLAMQLLPSEQVGMF